MEARKFTKYRPRKEQRKVEQVALRKGSKQRKESLTATVGISAYMEGERREKERRKISI